eukprot:g1802.t1
MKGSSPKANTKTAAKTKASSPKGGKKAPAMKVAGMAMKSAGGAMKKEAKPLEKSPFYLIKSEPLTRMEKGPTGKMFDMKYSIDDLIVETETGTKGVASWDGVRNFLARNIMRSMKKGDKAFFYHSNAKPSGIVGVVEVVREAYPDPTQWEKEDPHYDSKSSKDDPKWDQVDVKFVRKLKRLIPLEELKSDAFLKKSMQLVQGNRAPSVSMVSKAEWDYILKELETKK